MNKVAYISKTVIFLYIFSTIAWAQNIHDDIISGKIPLPSDAQEVVGSYGAAGQGSDNSALYATKFSREQIVKFYAREMVKRGWQDQETLGEFFKKNKLSTKTKTLEGQAVDAQKVLSNIIHFRRNEETFALLILPGSYKQGQTLISLYYLPDTTLRSNVQEDRPLPASIPLYPGAQFISHRGSTYSYITPDDLQTVISFYKLSMPANSWSLKGETPERQDTINVPVDPPDINEICPDCSSDVSLSQEIYTQLQQSGGITTRYTKLNFDNDEKNRCSISLIQVQNQGLSQGTQINIIIER